jgi:hypothetical protein
MLPETSTSATSVLAAHAGARHRQRQQRHGERAQEEQQPLLQAQPADLALVHLGQEVERGESHLARLPAREQVDQHRDRGGGEPEQEQRVEEVHARPRVRPGLGGRRMALREAIISPARASRARRRPTTRCR